MPLLLSSYKFWESQGKCSELVREKIETREKFVSYLLFKLFDKSLKDKTVYQFICFLLRKGETKLEEDKKLGLISLLSAFALDKEGDPLLLPKLAESQIRGFLDRGQEWGLIETDFDYRRKDLENAFFQQMALFSLKDLVMRTFFCLEGELGILAKFNLLGLFDSNESFESFKKRAVVSEEEIKEKVVLFFKKESFQKKEEIEGALEIFDLLSKQNCCLSRCCSGRFTEHSSSFSKSSPSNLKNEEVRQIEKLEKLDNEELRTLPLANLGEQKEVNKQNQKKRDFSSSSSSFCIRKRKSILETSIEGKEQQVEKKKKLNEVVLETSSNCYEEVKTSMKIEENMIEINNNEERGGSYSLSNAGQGDLEELRSSMSLARDRLIQAKESYEAKEEFYLKLDGELKDKELSLIRIKGEVRNKDIEISSLKGKLESLEKKLENERNSKAKLEERWQERLRRSQEEQLKTSQREKEENLLETKKLEEDLRVSEAREKSLLDSENSLKGKISELRSKNSELNENLSAMNRGKERSDKQLELLKKKISKFEKKEEEWNKERKNKDEKLREQLLNLRELQDERKAQLSELKELREKSYKNDVLKEEKEHLEKELDGLKNECLELRNSFEEKTIKIADLSNKNDVLKEEKEHLEKELDGLKNESRETKKRLERKIDDLEKKGNEKLELEGELRRELKESSELNKNIKEEREKTKEILEYLARRLKSKLTDENSDDVVADFDANDNDNFYSEQFSSFKKVLESLDLKNIEIRTQREKIQEALLKLEQLDKEKMEWEEKYEETNKRKDFLGKSLLDAGKEKEEKDDKNRKLKEELGKKRNQLLKLSNDSDKALKRLYVESKEKDNITRKLGQILVGSVIVFSIVFLFFVVFCCFFDIKLKKTLWGKNLGLKKNKLRRKSF